MSAGPGDDAPFQAMEIMRAIKIAGQRRSEGSRPLEGEVQERGFGGWTVGFGRDDRLRAAESFAQSRSQDSGNRAGSWALEGEHEPRQGEQTDDSKGEIERERRNHPRNQVGPPVVGGVERAGAA